MQPIDPNQRRAYIKPMKESQKTNPDSKNPNQNSDPHASDAEDLAQFAADDQVDLSNLGESPDEADATEQTVIAELTAQLTAAKDQTMRALAEAENTRKRSVKDRQDANRFAVTSFARDMLEVADNLRRALDAFDKDKLSENPQVTGLVTGIEGTEKHLLKTFEKNQIMRIDPMDQPFDPNFHEVMFETPMPGKAAGTIIQVMEVGYKIHDRLLRPARVGVVKAGDAPAPDPNEPHEPGETIDTNA